MPSHKESISDSEVNESSDVASRSHRVPWAKQWVLIVFVAAVGILGLWLTKEIPVRSLIQIGGDEHFEVTKSVLWAHGYILYKTIWNDQPPLYTVVMGFLFRLFGSSIGVARVLAMAFGLSLLTAFFLLLNRRHGLLAACVGTLCLLAAPHVLALCISAMLEVPAMATAFWSIYVICVWKDTNNVVYLVVSAAIMALAFQIKLTAGLLSSVVFVEIIQSSSAFEMNQIRRQLQYLAVWSVSCLIGFFALGFILGSGYAQALTSHFSQSTIHSEAAHKFAPSLGMFLVHKDGLFGTIIGIVTSALYKDTRRSLIPVLVLLCAVALVHAVHRPYWDYYYLHFALPMCWLTGIGFSNLFHSDADAGHQFRTIFTAIRISAVGLMLFLGGIVCGNRLISEIDHLKNLPRIEDSPLIATMKAYAPKTKWVYTTSTIYPFHAKLLVIPELAVLPSKRFWSEEISDDQIWNIVKRYQPEQILLAQSVPKSGEEFLETNYIKQYDDEMYRLYVWKSLLGKSEDPATHEPGNK
jgi:hypothetical protein